MKNEPNRDLRPLFAPRSVAIVGASERSMIASGTLNGLRNFGFSGPIYPINPNRSTIFGLAAYPSLSAVPGPVDLAVIIVPADSVPAVIDECVNHTIPAALVMSSGFAETGPDGASSAQHIAQVAEAHGISLCGPGTFGLISVRERVSAFMSPLSGDLVPGPVAVVTQSGGLVNVIVGLGQERHLGFSYLVSAGSEASVQLTDYWSYFLEDEHTRVLGGIVEQFRDPQALVTVAQRAATLGKPLVVLKLGRSEAARRASLAHTGALAGSPAFHDAFFRRYGILATNNLDEFMETLALLASLPSLPRGKRLGLVSISGGDCVLATDLATRAGLEFPAFAETTQHAIAALVPEAGLTGNPVDVGMRPMWEAGLFARVVQVAAQDPNVDVVAARLHPTPALFRGMRPAAQIDVPLVAITRATQALPAEYYAVAEDINVPILQEFEKGFRAIAHAADYADFQRRRSVSIRSTRVSPSPSDALRARLTGSSRVLTEYHSKRILAEYGLPVAREHLVQDAEAAAAAADALGYPVVLKAMSPEIVHKTEAGLVRLGLATSDAVRAAFAEIVGLARLDLDGVLVQEQAPPGVELLLGMTRDAQFGPGIVFGLGGVLVETLQETTLRLPPLDHADASSMLDATRAGAVLRGVRGRAAADLPQLADVLVRFGEFCDDFRDVLEAVDINPLLVYPAGQGMKIVDATIILSAHQED